MDILTLYAAQGDLAAVRSGGEAIIVDAHMPECDDVTPQQIEQALAVYLQGMRVRGMILTGLDRDHACPAGVASVLASYTPDWVMYPKYYKDTDAASEVFDTIARHVSRRANSNRPLARVSVSVDRMHKASLVGLAPTFDFQLFSPHTEDMDCSNNSGIVVKITGLDATGFSYLVTGDTEVPRWERINSIFGDSLRSHVLSAPHHGSKTGVHIPSLLKISPNTVLISAGVDNSYGHPDGQAVAVYQRTAKHVFSTNADGGVCLLTRPKGSDFTTTLVKHVPLRAA
ncbi:MAG TPA: hypothetical protein VME66_15290 [Candidatus Acidoferrales bacterium]|nr:hypothetical protein [Candidatus Acidoferrales bacterium]